MNILSVHCLDPLRIELKNSDVRVRGVLVDAMRFEIMESTGPREITIPAGFSTDLASIPRPVWSIPGFSPFDRIAKPSILHDGLYSTSIVHPYTRAESDQILSLGMKDEGENLFIRETVYQMVRWFGGGHWKVNP